MESDFKYLGKVGGMHKFDFTCFLCCKSFTLLLKGTSHEVECPELCGAKYGMKTEEESASLVCIWPPTRTERKSDDVLQELRAMLLEGRLTPEQVREWMRKIKSGKEEYDA